MAYMRFPAEPIRNLPGATPIVPDLENRAGRHGLGLLMAWAWLASRQPVVCMAIARSFFVANQKTRLELPPPPFYPYLSYLTLPLRYLPTYPWSVHRSLPHPPILNS